MGHFYKIITLNVRIAHEASSLKVAVSTFTPTRKKNLLPLEYEISILQDTGRHPLQSNGVPNDRNNRIPISIF